MEKDKVLITTKWFPFPKFACSIRKSRHNSQEELNPYPIDLYQIHNPYSFSSIPKQMAILAEEMRKGNFQYTGVSNFSAGQMREAHDELENEGYKLVSNQVEYSLLNRDIKKNGILETAEELNITIIAYSPLAQGILTGKYHENPEMINQKGGFRKFLPSFHGKELKRTKPLINALQNLGKIHQKSPAQAALNWVVTKNRGRVAVIPGASSVDHAKENARSLDFELSEAEVAELDEISRSINV